MLSTAAMTDPTSCFPPRLPSRVVIEGVAPQIDDGLFPIKRCVGESVHVEADVLCDGHEVLAVVLKSRALGETEWQEAPMSPAVNDRWSASFLIRRLVDHEYTVEAWIDRYATWRRDLSRRFEAGQDVESELLEGAALIRAANPQPEPAAAWLSVRADLLSTASTHSTLERVQLALDPALTGVSWPSDRFSGMQYPRVLRVTVERERARYGSWYELFPRSAADQPGRHGTFADVERRLPYISAMGFDVLYLPPIHPIGRTHRKGPNNTLTAGPDDVGSPWAIGGAEGGHTAVHPELGTLADFDRLVAAAREYSIEIALDIAFQCSPDHPWVREHPEWFRHRPDGSIKYAENPPKKYQDIYPLDFECEDWRGLWSALRDVMLFWADRGIRIFRVDNPHTKPFRFWEWVIREVRRQYPDVLCLSEAFTRPKVMKYLAKAGFSQSYTYFTWRNAKRELVEYFTELTNSAVAETMRPNLFVNTPDILPEHLQYGGEAAFRARFVLAATLGASYGIYGPTFETYEHQPVKPNSEEYLNSEKYQVRHWDWQRHNVFRELIARVNRIRRENPALQSNDSLTFHETSNEQLLCYSKSTPDLENLIICVINLDPHFVQSGYIELPLEQFHLRADETYQLHDLLTEGRFLWRGGRNYVELDPKSTFAHVLRLRRRVRTERDFDYFM